MCVGKWYAMHAVCTSNCMELIGRIPCVATPFTHVGDDQKETNQLVEVRYSHFTIYLILCIYNMSNTYNALLLEELIS